MLSAEERLSGSQCSIGIKKSVKACASVSLNLYFSYSTFFSGQKLRPLMCLRCPSELKYLRERCPESAIDLGILPSSSIIYAR